MNHFDIILKDYVNWKLDNVEILEKFKDNKSLIYDRLEPVYVVLDHIYERAVNHKILDEDMETIFQTGLNYLHDQFDVIKIYYEKLFNSNCQAFEAYTPLVGYLLFVSDFRADLEESDESIDFSELNEVEILIENMIAEKRTDFDYVANQLNVAIQKIINGLSFEYVSITDIYVEIAENLGITLSIDEDYVMGEDI